MGGASIPVPPAGDVTFVLTDIEGSTAILARLGAERFSALLATHHRLVGDPVVRHGGMVFKSEGDGLLIAFERALDAVRAAVDAQQALTAASWPDAAPRVRIVLHRGPALVENGDYVSMALHRAVRLLSAVHGGQVVCSGDVLAGIENLDVPARLLGAFWVRDFPDAVPLHQLDAGDGTAEFPALRVPRADLTNIQTTGAQLIGRGELVAEVEAALADARLVTTVGTGGVGKTSVAVDVAERLARQGTAAWLVEFATVERQPGEADAAIEQRLVAAVGRALGMPVEARDAVLSRLAGRDVTLVLDNCEHVIDPAASLITDILATCPQARVLATSREQLNLPGEIVIPVAPLEVPDRDATLTDIAGAPAVQLLVERARQANPSFHLTEQNADALADLCRELDGIPLVLELAGTATRHMAPRDMTRRLREVGTLPLQASRHPVARHRTLAALLDWSLASLTDDQARVFRRLGAFAAPASAEAVRAVCSGASRWDVLDTLGVLVDKNLVVMRDEGGATRFDMLVTMRRAARQLLDEAGELDEALRAHARWVVDRTLALNDALGSERRAAEAEMVAETVIVLDRADRLGLSAADQVVLVDSQTVRIALRAPDVSLRLTEALLARDDLTAAERSHVYAVRVRTWGVGTESGLVDEAIGAARASNEPRDLFLCLIARIQGTRGVVDVRQAHQLEPSPERPEIASLVDRLGRPNRIVSVAENTFGLDDARTGRYPAARRHFERALRAAESDEDVFNAGAALYNIGEVDELSGDEKSAMDCYARAAEIFRVHEFHLQYAASAMAVAALHEKWGELSSAGDWVADALLAARRSGGRELLVDVLGATARIAAIAGDSTLAAASAREALTLAPDGPDADTVQAILDGLAQPASA